MVTANENGHEQQWEFASALAVVGWAVFLFDALLLFFLPAGMRLGQKYFLVVTVAVAVLGLSIAIVGHILKRKSRQ